MRNTAIALRTVQWLRSPRSGVVHFYGGVFGHPDFGRYLFSIYNPSQELSDTYGYLLVGFIKRLAVAARSV